MNLLDPFLIIGIILFAGFAANLIFSRTRISHVLLLIVFGFLLGPVFGVLDASSGSAIALMVPFVGTLALVILVFDGGLSLDFFEMVRILPKATFFTLAVFAASLVGVAALAIFVFKWRVLYGLLLGAALAGTSFEVVWAMMQKIDKLSPHSKAILALESTFTDDLSIIIAVALIQLIKANSQIDLTGIVSSLAGSFSTALVAGAIGGAIWFGILRKLRKEEFPYMLTLASAFVVYAIVQTFRANGGIAVFAFGLVLGNSKRLSAVFGSRRKQGLDPEVFAMQREVTFLTSTFFLVFLGLLLNPQGISGGVLFISIALSVLFVLVRLACQRLLLPSSSDSLLLVTMLPRGLAAAVIASLPAAQGVNIAGFATIALLVIAFTNLIATAGVFVQGRVRATRLR